MHVLGTEPNSRAFVPTSKDVDNRSFDAIERHRARIGPLKQSNGKN
ncbi:hypothetical protein CEXT_704801, partial [Caerostris extrusa]